MRPTWIFAGVASLALAAPAAAAADNDEGFLTLFDGSDLAQWIIPEGDNGHWKVVDGVIDYDARSEAPGNKNLISKREFGDFALKLDWRIKETPYINKNVPYVLPDGTHARGVDGKELKLALPDSDSGVYLRDMQGKSQVNIWCWPIGSGEVYGYRMDKSQPASVRAGVTPRTQADRPVGEWNSFQITLKGDRLTVVLNGKTVIENAELPGIPRRGPVALQHHGGFKDGHYTGPPSLVQFRNIKIKPLSEGARSSASSSMRREQLLTRELPDLTGKEVRVVRLEHPPGSESSPHRHPGHVFVYMLDGSMTSQVEGSEPKTYSAGQMFYEAPNQLHLFSRNTSDKIAAKFLAFIIIDKEKPTTVPAK